MLVTGTAITSFAGQWVQEGNNWKYQNDNGIYAGNWQWIDGKSYYFDQSGNLLTDTTTPDGHTVNADGAWTVNGIVQTQNTSKSVANTSNYDPQYPLKGYIESWFVTSPFGVTTWKNDANNFFFEADNHLKYTQEWIVKNGDPLALNSILSWDGSLQAVAKLADYQTVGLGPSTPADEEKYTSEIDRKNFREYINSFDWKAENDKYYYQVDHLAEEIRNFLNSFDWKNASDFEKAVRIARRITKADYQADGDTQYAYTCLVDGKANCDGYTHAAQLLAACVGLPAVGIVPTVNHVYPAFLVDGVWLAYEPTIKDDTFKVADVWTKTHWGEIKGIEEYQTLGEFCKATGYEIPTIERVEAMFPGRISLGLIRGERAAFIRFLNENSSSYEYVKKNWNLPY